MAAAENTNGDGDIYGMDSYIQAAGVDVAVDDEYINQNEESSSVVEKNQIQSRTNSVGARDFSDHELIDIIVECTQYDESLQECLDRMDTDEKNWDLNMANRMLEVIHSFLEEQTLATYNVVSSAHVETFEEMQRIKSVLNKLDTTTNSINSLLYQFRIGTDNYGTDNNDGQFTKLIKRILKENTDVRSNTGDISRMMNWFNVDGYNYTSTQQYDGVFTKLIKYQISQPLDDILDEVDRANTLTDMYFGAVNSSYTVHENDKIWTRLFKYSLQDGQKTYEYLRDIDKTMDGWYMKDASSVVSDGDGNMARLFKLMRAEIQSIDKNVQKLVDKPSTGGAGATAKEIFTAFENSLKDFQKSLDKMVKYLKDFEFTGEGGTNLWDVLETMIDSLGDGFGDLIDGIGDLLDFTENIMDMFIEVFVPKENVIKDGFEDLRVLIAAKFKSMNALTNVLNSTFSQPEKEFKDITVTLPSFGTVDILKSQYMNAALPVTRNLIGGAMILFTSIWAYRKITTELIT